MHVVLLSLIAFVLRVSREERQRFGVDGAHGRYGSFARATAKLSLTCGRPSTRRYPFAQRLRGKTNMSAVKKTECAKRENEKCV